MNELFVDYEKVSHGHVALMILLCCESLNNIACLSF